MAPTEGDVVSDVETPLCDGETFRSITLPEALGPRGGVSVRVRSERLGFAVASGRD